MATENNPLITVIVPVYKVEKYLNRCVDSILAQTYTNFECILVDDGSPDKSPVICDEYAKKDNRVRVIHKVNGGVSSARNAGLDAAKGEWVCFVDSDDWVEKNYLEVMTSAAGKYKCDLVVCGINEQLKSGKFIKRSYFSKNYLCKSHSEVLKIFCFLRKKPENVSSLHSPFNKLYKSSLLNGVRFRTDIKMGEDYLFNLAYFDTDGSMFLLSECLYNYCFNESSATNVITEKNFFDNLTIVEETYRFYEKNALKKTSADDFAAIMTNWAANKGALTGYSSKENICLEGFRKHLTYGALFRVIIHPRKFIVLLLFKFHCSSILIKFCKRFCK